MPTIINKSKNSFSKSLSVRSVKGSRDLLEEASADVAESLDPESEVVADLAHFVIQDYLFEYPRERDVPEGWYRSEIFDLAARMKGGKEILDVSYVLQNSHGQKFYIMQSYPQGSAPLKKFYTSMINFGLDAGLTVEDVIGVTETIRLEYPSGSSKIGSIVKRVPYYPPDETTEEDE